jgi:hypothetical protein
MNAFCCIVFEGPRLSVQAIMDAGLLMLFMNAAVAFCLNVAVVFLIGKTSSLVLTLSGVLKDILLVILSVIIWSTPVTALQMFGYAIALGGLIWYKIGGEQAQAAYQKLTGDENSVVNRFRRSLWAKIGAGLLVIFVVVATGHGLSRGRGIDTAATHTGLTGVPEPEMVDAYQPATEVYQPATEVYQPAPEVYQPEDYLAGDGSSSQSQDFEPWDEVNTHSTHYTQDMPANEYDSSVGHGVSHVSDPDSLTPPIGHQSIGAQLDIVFYVSPTASMNDTLATFREVTSLPMISAMNPNVISYGEALAEFPATQAVVLGTITSASAAFLHYMANHYDTLAQHTIFLHTGVDAYHISTSIATRFSPHSGVVELSRGGYGECVCTDCIDTFDTAGGRLSKTDELYALTNANICSPSDRILVTPNLQPF